MAGSPAFPKLRGTDEQASREQDNISAQLQPIARALSVTPIMGAAPPPWLKPDLRADFLNIAGFAAAGYHKDALGYVHGKGVVSTAAGQAAAALVYVLPAGYRPNETQRFAVEGNGATVQFISIAANGEVRVEVLIGVGGSLDLGFVFLAER